MAMTIKEAVNAAKKLGLQITGLPNPKVKLPTTKLGSLVDEYHATRELRLAIDKVASAIKEEETRLADHIIDNLDKHNEGGAVGKRYKGIIIREKVPQVADLDKFYEHVRKTKSFDLLNKALNKAAVKARYENGKAVPGVEDFPTLKLSVTKV